MSLKALDFFVVSQTQIQENCHEISSLLYLYLGMKECFEMNRTFWKKKNDLKLCKLDRAFFCVSLFFIHCWKPLSGIENQ